MDQDEEDKLNQLVMLDIMGQQTPTTDVAGYGTFAAPGSAGTSIQPAGLDVTGIAPGVTSGG